MRSRLRRIDHEDSKTEFVAFAFLLPCVGQCAGRVRRSDGAIHRTTPGSDITTPGPGRATNTGTVAATGSADRIVSGRFGGANPRSGHLSRPNCGSRPVAATTRQIEG